MYSPDGESIELAPLWLTRYVLQANKTAPVNENTVFGDALQDIGDEVRECSSCRLALSSERSPSSPRYIYVLSSTNIPDRRYVPAGHTTVER